MAIEVNDFVIQAKVIQAADNDAEVSSSQSSDNQTISPSVKKEIIDECMQKVKELLIRQQNRF